MTAAPRNWRNTPSTEYRFFFHDPEGSGMRYFQTAEERDTAANDAIQDCLDDGWSEGVTEIAAGELTHHTIRHSIVLRPKREDFPEGSDGDAAFETALTDFGSPEWQYKCGYSLAPLSVPSEPEPSP